MNQTFEIHSGDLVSLNFNLIHMVSWKIVMLGKEKGIGFVAANNSLIKTTLEKCKEVQGEVEIDVCEFYGWKGFIQNDDQFVVCCDVAKLMTVEPFPSIDGIDKTKNSIPILAFPTLERKKTGYQAGIPANEEDESDEGTEMDEDKSSDSSDHIGENKWLEEDSGEESSKTEADQISAVAGAFERQASLKDTVVTENQEPLEGTVYTENQTPSEGMVVEQESKKEDDGKSDVAGQPKN